MPGKGWVALRDRVVRSSLYLSVGKDYFSEWGRGAVVHLPESLRGIHSVGVLGGKVWREGRPLNPVSNFVSSSDTWYESKQRFAYVLGFDAAHKITLYMHRHDVGVFHHSTTFAARPVIDAGMMSIVNGRIVHIEHKSGHYKPEFPRVQATLQFLQRAGIDLKSVFFSPSIPLALRFDVICDPRTFSRFLHDGKLVLYVADDVVNAPDVYATPVVTVSKGRLFRDRTKIVCD
ncbi:hypothetical protein N5D52_21650 [Pseudomonas sp. GD03860]|uniref:hypothetical protein n=1 Tax=Pseudomonas TaxID=286 RepID=UPI00236490C8|nr:MULTISPECIES: hypothetical protein [Pseudomonas]MDD2058593.1 hypothetical protein [Pseudomonas putida]MDH0639542.1 hypothetical protein [Pseudomonas sp. GD03860]